MDHGSEHIYTPSELNREIKLHLEMGFPRLTLEAEISNLARPASGHLYFSLKDERAQIRCAMFRSAASRISIRPENGMKVLARGRISLYEPRGEYQFIVDGMQEAGEGLLQRQYEELKKKLEAEGLFDTALKKALPGYPSRIGLITSPSGAAVRDLLHVLARRWPAAAVRLYPVRVQGTEAPGELLEAIQQANRHDWAETLIIGRGGGSLEDLLAFNDEAVARAVADSTIPVISAVGHETDFSICDFVADLRAPTPSAAAELATPDQAVLKEAYARAERQLLRRLTDRMQRDTQRLDSLGHRLHQRHPARHIAEQGERLAQTTQALRKTLQRNLEQSELRVKTLAHRLEAHQPERKLEDLASRVSALSRAMERALAQAVHNRQQRLQTLARTLNAVSPLETIGRGYAIITSTETGEVINSITKTKSGDAVSARVEDGFLDCTVDRVR